MAEQRSPNPRVGGSNPSSGAKVSINIFMPKPFIELTCPDYHEINADVLTYLHDRTGILQKDPRQDPTIHVPYPNFVDTRDFVVHNPKLVQYLYNMKLRIKHVYYAVTWTPVKENTTNPFETFGNPDLVSSCPIHMDRPPVQWKMNWPVMNVRGTGMRFFQPTNSQDDVATYLVRCGQAGSMDNDHWMLPYELFEETHRHIFGSAPLLINGLVPHDVWFGPDANFPRIGLQIMFFNEPRHLLDNDCVILDDQ